MAHDDICYMRLRAMSESREIAGKTCLLCEPVSKSGKLIDNAWPLWLPEEWLIPLDDMRKAVSR
jgi:hypothetical protein